MDRVKRFARPYDGATESDTVLKKLYQLKTKVKALLKTGKLFALQKIYKKCSKEENVEHYSNIIASVQAVPLDSTTQYVIIHLILKDENVKMALDTLFKIQPSLFEDISSFASDGISLAIDDSQKSLISTKRIDSGIRKLTRDLYSFLKQPLFATLSNSAIPGRRSDRRANHPNRLVLSSLEANSNAPKRLYKSSDAQSIDKEAHSNHAFLHPSWQAKRRNAPHIAQFSGRRTKFDD